MQIGIVGLGRMGGNIALRLMAGGHVCMAYDHDPLQADKLAAAGFETVQDLPELVAALARPRAVWIMLPAGDATETANHTFSLLLPPGDIIIDGGNTFWEDDVRRAAQLAERGIDHVDAGTSGGIWGLERGYSLMIGRSPASLAYLDPVFKSLAPGILAKDGTLQHLEGQVGDSGEGRWAVSAAIKQRVPADVLAAALNARFRSRQEHTFGDKLLWAMREEFGGHREAVQESLQGSANSGLVQIGAYP